jgi:hypothetical protein
MHIIREDVSVCPTLSILKYNNEIICVIPTEYVKNTIAGIERMHSLGKEEAQQEIYNNGYQDGVKDIISDIQKVCEIHV